jgi:hypothetical protein
MQTPLVWANLKYTVSLVNCGVGRFIPQIESQRYTLTDSAGRLTNQQSKGITKQIDMLYIQGAAMKWWVYQLSRW